MERRTSAANAILLRTDQGLRLDRVRERADCAAPQQSRSRRLPRGTIGRPYRPPRKELRARERHLERRNDTRQSSSRADTPERRSKAAQLSKRGQYSARTMIQSKHNWLPASEYLDSPTQK